MYFTALCFFVCGIDIKSFVKSTWDISSGSIRACFRSPAALCPLFYSNLLLWFVFVLYFFFKRVACLCFEWYEGAEGNLQRQVHLSVDSLLPVGMGCDCKMVSCLHVTAVWLRATRPEHTLPPTRTEPRTSCNPQMREWKKYCGYNQMCQHQQHQALDVVAGSWSRATEDHVTCS